MATQTEPKQHIAVDLLARGHPPETTSTIFRDKIQHRPLHLRPSSPDARARRRNTRDQKSKKKKKKIQPLSAKEKRSLGLYNIPPSQQMYRIYEPLHELWKTYIREVLGLDGGRTYLEPNSAGPLLVSADYHGALLEVVRSRCPSRVGLKGIVVKDTKFTFEMVTRGDKVKTVPKEFTLFRFEIPFEMKEGGESEGRKPLVFEIHGSQFESRAADRANKKFRAHYDPDL